MTMQHQLTRLRAGAGEAQTINHIVQAGFEQTEQVFTGNARHLLRHFEIVAELAFQHAIVTAGVLLGTQLLAVFGNLLASLAMLAGRIGAAVNRALLGIAALALQKQFLTLAAAESAHRTGISSHLWLHLLIWVTLTFERGFPSFYTRLLLGGRQPL